jgi:tetratricopeptide (TPR) repeat protein
MPKNPVRDVRHSVYTDHAIGKPGRTPVASSRDRLLVPFGAAQAGDREFGLAYAGVPGFEERAIQYLEQAPRNDPDVLLHLAFLYDSKGDEPRAIPLYERALQLDPTQVTAAVNLAVARLHRGQPQEAIRLWRHALDRSPGLENARFSMAVVQYRLGQIREAEESLEKLLELNPGAANGRKLLNEIRMRH